MDPTVLINEVVPNLPLNLVFSLCQSSNKAILTSCHQEGYWSRLLQDRFPSIFNYLVLHGIKPGRSLYIMTYIGTMIEQHLTNHPYVSFEKRDLTMTNFDPESIQDLIDPWWEDFGYTSFDHHVEINRLYDGSYTSTLVEIGDQSRLSSRRYLSFDQLIEYLLAIWIAPGDVFSLSEDSKYIYPDLEMMLHPLLDELQQSRYSTS